MVEATMVELVLPESIKNDPSPALRRVKKNHKQVSKIETYEEFGEDVSGVDEVVFVMTPYRSNAKQFTNQVCVAFENALEIDLPTYWLLLLYSNYSAHLWVEGASNIAKGFYFQEKEKSESGFFNIKGGGFTLNGFGQPYDPNNLF